MASTDSMHPRDQRISQLLTKLRHRTDGSGKALKGYEENVSAIQAEITRLKETPRGE